MGLSKQVNEMIKTGSLKYEKGKFELLGIRGMVMPVPTYRFLLEEMYKQNSDEMFDMLYNMGYKHGKIAVEDVGRRNKISKKGFVDYIDTANLMGLGEITVEKCDFEKKEFKGTIEDSPLVEEFEKSELLSETERPIHQFWRGVFHSFTEELFECEIVSEEKKCERLGDNRCVIVCYEETDEA